MKMWRRVLAMVAHDCRAEVSVVQHRAELLVGKVDEAILVKDAVLLLELAQEGLDLVARVRVLVAGGVDRGERFVDVTRVLAFVLHIVHQRPLEAVITTSHSIVSTR